MLFGALHHLAMREALLERAHVVDHQHALEVVVLVLDRDREQAFVLKAIREDIDLSRHMDDAVQSLRICLAADESVRTGQPAKL